LPGLEDLWRRCYRNLSDLRRECGARDAVSAGRYSLRRERLEPTMSRGRRRLEVLAGTEAQGEMMSRRLVAALALAPVALSAQSISYVDSSTAEKLQSKVDFGIEQHGFDLNADMTLIGEQGTTKVLPRITSSWTTLEFLDVKTVFVYPDLNAVQRATGPDVSTNVLVYSELPFLERVEATLRRAEETARSDVNVRFAPLGTGIEVLGGRPLGVRTDVTFRDE